VWHDEAMMTPAEALEKLGVHGDTLAATERDAL
jgi:hypothetical protein